MLRHDLVHNPPPSGQVSKTTLTKVKTDLEAQPLKQITEEEIEQVGYFDGGSLAELVYSTNGIQSSWWVWLTVRAHMWVGWS